MPLLTWTCSIAAHADTVRAATAEDAARRFVQRWVYPNLRRAPKSDVVAVPGAQNMYRVHTQGHLLYVTVVHSPRRAGPGRPRGERVALKTTVLPETLAAIDAEPGATRGRRVDAIVGRATAEGEK